MSVDIPSISIQLAQAVEMMVNPSIPQAQRQQAYQQIEEFKETSPYGSQCGFYLCTATNTSPYARHFGFKILEDIVKARWNDMSGEEKVYIKDSLMKLVASGTKNIMEEQNHIKDALAKIVVELIKREWPQQWPSLLAELESLSSMGETQTELVMYILLRLIEDVAVLQTLEQNQRRKEIQSALSANMEELFSFLLRLLEMHYKSYLEKKGSPKGAEHSKVCMSILNTFTSLVEWVPMQHIMANDKYLLRCLVHLLTDSSLQIQAAECLLGVANWKTGKNQGRSQLLCLFESDFMGPIFNAVERAEKQSLEEQHYFFLKKLVEMITMLGEIICALTKETPLPIPNIKIYLDALLELTRHPSQAVNYMVNELWCKFFRHQDLGAIINPLIPQYVTPWCGIAVKKAVKIGGPEESGCKVPSCAYSLLDHDDEEEWKTFFVKYRHNIIETVRVVAGAGPQQAAIPLNLLDEWLRRVLGGQIEFGLQLELEAIAVLLDVVYSKLSTAEQVRPFSAQTVGLTRLCLEYQTEDPKLLSELISCISAMFVVVLEVPDALQPILAKIFTILSTINPPNFANGVSNKTQVGKDIRNLRRHCCALMIKLSGRFPSVLITPFHYLREEIDRLNREGRLTKMEYVSLLEALVLISNQLGNYQQQVEFLRSISEPFLQEFRSLQHHYRTPDAFITFIGVDKPPTTTECTNQHGQQRSQLSMLINLLLAVSRRAEVLPDRAVSGGFTTQLPNGKVINRNPCGGLMCSVLEPVLLLGSTLNQIFLPGGMSKVHPDFVKAFDLLEVDRSNILSLPGSRSAKNELAHQVAIPEPVTKAQTFISETYENIQHFLSHLSINIGYEFYQQPNLAEGLCMTTLANLETVPDFRLRAVNKMFMKSFIDKCPVEFLPTVIIPILRQIVPMMLTRYQNRWAYLKKLRENTNFDENNTDSQEVLDDAIIRVSAREYLDIIKTVLTGSGGQEHNENNNSLGVLGELVLSDQQISQPLALTCLKALHWPDGNVGTRAAALVELIIPRFSANPNFGPDEASTVMIEVLSAFQDMGMHELNNIALTQLALNCYSTFRPRFPNILNILQQVPGCNPEDLEKFDAKIMAANANPNSAVGEKAKKDMFKKLITQLVGKEVGLMFKKDIVIKNLPSMAPLKVKAKTPSLDEQTDKNGQDTGLSALFGQ